MQKSTWIIKIKTCCEAAGTYQPFFKYTIETLAEILEKRDLLMSDFEIDDDETLVVETARNGRIINPLITEWKEMNKLALQFWKELGLTPQALKKMNEDMFKKQKDSKSGNTLLKLLEQKEKKAT